MSQTQVGSPQLARFMGQRDSISMCATLLSLLTPRPAAGTLNPLMAASCSLDLLQLKLQQLRNRIWIDLWPAVGTRKKKNANTDAKTNPKPSILWPNLHIYPPPLHQTFKGAQHDGVSFGIQLAPDAPNAPRCEIIMMMILYTGCMLDATGVWTTNN